MSQHIFWIFKADVNPQQRTELEELAARFCAVAEQEPGVIGYQWSTTPDGKQLHIYERFAGGDAAQVHLKTIGPHLGELMALAKPVTVECYGAFTDAFKQAVSKMPMVFMDTFAGFHR